MCGPTFSGRSPTRKLQRPAVVPRPRFIIRAAPMPGPHQIFQEVRAAPLRSAGCGETTRVMVRMPVACPRRQTEIVSKHVFLQPLGQLIDTRGNGAIR